MPDCRTVHELVQRSIERFADRPACGTRTYLGEQQKEGVRAPLKMFGETCWISYEEFGLAIEGFGMGLLRLGLEPIPPKARACVSRAEVGPTIACHRAAGWDRVRLGGVLRASSKGGRSRGRTWPALWDLGRKWALKLGAASPQKSMPEASTLLKIRAAGVNFLAKIPNGPPLRASARW